MKKLFLSISLAFAAATAFATVQIQPTPDKPWRLYRLSDTQIKDAYTHNNYSGVEADWAGDADGDENYDDQHWTHYDHTWKFSPGGSGSRQDTDITVDWDGTVYTNATSGVMQWSPVDGIETDTANDGTVTTNLIGLPTFGDEHCIVNDPKNPPAVVYGLDGWDDDIVTNTYSEEYFRYAQTKWHLETGGKAISQRQNLWQFTGWAKKILDKRAVPTFGGANMQDITNTAVAIGSIGTLTADGTYWKALPDGQSLDATPLVSGPDFYAFGVGAQKYTAYVSANDVALDPDTINVTNCVGQKIIFKLAFDPALPSGILITNQNQWWLPPKYVNAKKWFQPAFPPDGSGNYYVTTCDPVNTWLDSGGYGINEPYCTFYRQESWPLTQPETGAWWVSGGAKAVSCYPALTLANGQKISLTVRGNFMSYRPSVSSFIQDLYQLTWSFPTLQADMLWRVTVDSKYDGQYGISQLLLGTGIYYGTSGQYVLDGNSEIYGEQGVNGPKTYTASDSSTHTLNFQDDPNAPTTSLDLKFKDYLRFQPSGSDSIYVTIATNGWSVNASVNVLTGILTPTNIPPATYPVDNDSFPEWTGVRPGGGN